MVRASVFQKALDSARQISPADMQTTIPRAAFWIILSDAWCFPSISLPKLAVGILIIRLFRPARWLRISILTVTISLIVMTCIGLLITYVQCDPIAGQWNPFKYPKTVCWDRTVQIYYSIVCGGKSNLHRSENFDRRLTSPK